MATEETVNSSQRDNQRNDMALEKTSVFCVFGADLLEKSPESAALATRFAVELHDWSTS